MTRFQKLSVAVWCLCCLFAGINFILTYRWIDSSSDPAWTEGHENDKVIVLRLRPDVAASGLKAGDRLLLFDHQPVKPDFSINSAFKGKPVGTPYSLKIERAGQELDFRLKTHSFSPLIWFTTTAAVVVNPLLFLSFAFLLILFSQADYRALLLAWAFAMTIPEVLVFSLADTPKWMAWTMIIGRPISYLAFPLYLRFCLYFPHPSVLLQRWLWLRKRYYFYLPWFLCSSVFVTAYYFKPDSTFWLRNSPIGFLARFGTILIYLPVAFYVIHLAYSRVEETARKKLQLIWWGFIVGFVPIVLRAFALTILGLLPNTVQSQFGLMLLDWSVAIAFVLLALFPVFLVIAIMRQELVPLEEPAKRAAKLTLMQVGFATIFVIVLIVSTVSMLYLSNSDFRDGPFGIRILILGLTLGIPFGILKIAEWVQKNHISVFVKSRSGIDTATFDNQPTFRFAVMALIRKVWRRLYKKPTLAHLRHETQIAIRQAVYPKEFASILAERTLEMFDAIEVAVFIAEPGKGCYELVAHSQAVRSRGYGLLRVTELTLPMESLVIKTLRNGSRPLVDPLTWLRRLKEFETAPSPENTIALETLSTFSSTILLPVRHDDQLPLVISINRPQGISRRQARALKRLAHMVAVENESASWRKVIESSELKIVLENLLIAAVRTIRPAQKGSIYLWNDKLQKLVIYAQYRYMPNIVRAIELAPGEGFAGKAFATNEQMIIDDFQRDTRGANVGDLQIKEIKSAMLIPFQAWGRTIGILCLDNVESTHAFERKHLMRVERFGSIVSLAVQNARVQTELRRFGATLDKGDASCDDILVAVLESVASFTEVKATNLLLVMDPRDFTAVNRQKPVLSIAKGFQNDAAFCESFTPRADGMTVDALESLKKFKDGITEQPVPIVYGSPENKPIRNPTGLEYGVKASICFPFQVNEFVAGMLFFNYFSSHSFQDSEIEALRLFANETALGIANALKREELQYIDQVVWMALLISGLQHDLNQSTDVIDNDLLILRTVMVNSPQKEFALRALSRIHDNVLEIQSHQERMKDAWNTDFAPVNLCALVREIAKRGCRANPRLRLDMTDLEHDSECRVHAVRLQLHLVIRNLISNAVRAALKSPSPSVVIQKRIHERRIELTITNTGEPIPPQIKARIFKEVIPDGELQQGGHGAGLWIGRRIIRRHQGDLDLLSSDESGTTFLLWLPLTPEPVEVQKETELAYEQF